MGLIRILDDALSPDTGKEFNPAIDKKTGKLKMQYTSTSFNNLKDMVILEKEKKAYLLNDNLLYQISL